MSSIIEAKNIYKVYNETKVPVNALNGVDLKIEEGEFTAIVGPSGSGKTTLLNILGGLDLPSKGDIFIEGTNLKTLNSRQLINFRLHNIGFVFQAYNLIPVLTALENTEFIMELQKISKKDRMQKAMELLEAVGIADKADQVSGDLFSGIVTSGLCCHAYPLKFQILDLPGLGWRYPSLDPYEGTPLL